ncbi:MAG: hypothetical protein KJO54_12590 [Gammaproteobacteria bacterium]|nr:hypothetical protein [Gammaproteobacteria bacterium]NNM20248.1 hypothetical protein [Gammaproteobacteria bacterium]
MNRSLADWLVLVPGAVLLMYLVYAQAIPAFDYELGVRMGTQESAQQITRVGAAFWYGFAFADLVIYIPLLLAGLYGYWRGSGWCLPVIGAALGITAYWPIVVLAAAVDARGVPGWQIAEAPYWVVLLPVFLWALWSLWQVTSDGRNDGVSETV